MQRALIVTVVLGVGSALVFAAAALTAMAFPNGAQVGGYWNGPIVSKGGVFGPGVMVAPGPVSAPIGLPKDGGGLNLPVPATPAPR